MVDFNNLDPRMRTAFDGFAQRYPNIVATSGYRDPNHNAAVGGAKDSAHLDGKAMDFSLKGVPDENRPEVVNYWRQQGATGLGFYPNSDSIHVDFRPGSNRAWGPNYSHTSLDQTPQWFQGIAAEHRGTQADPSQAQAPTQGVQQSTQAGLSPETQQGLLGMGLQNGTTQVEPAAAPVAAPNALGGLLGGTSPEGKQLMAGMQMLAKQQQLQNAPQAGLQTLWQLAMAHPAQVNRPQAPPLMMGAMGRNNTGQA